MSTTSNYIHFRVYLYATNLFVWDEFDIQVSDDFTAKSLTETAQAHVTESLGSTFKIDLMEKSPEISNCKELTENDLDLPLWWHNSLIDEVNSVYALYALLRKPESKL
ncbi:hypothetical protein GGI20_003303 [Coemansia sp. BCRC 34301]|nr:hypothetical protein GGI20_003303 [Coemansia sp. BCRC 34301]